VLSSELLDHPASAHLPTEHNNSTPTLPNGVWSGLGLTKGGKRSREDT